MIKNLLAYQDLDKKAISLRYMVEGGKVKREIDTANKMMNDAKESVVKLEDEAKSLTANYQSLEKSLREYVKEAEHLVAAKSPSNETEIATVDARTKELVEKIRTIGNQLELIGKSMCARLKSFDDAKNDAGKGANIVKQLTPQYESQKAQIKPKLDDIEKQMAALAPGIDKTLLAKYISRRKSEPEGKQTDIVVPLRNGRCGGCFVEMPPLIAHKINTDGYVVCEECGKILYKE